MDKSHLLIWMYRKVGIPSKYIHKKVQLNIGRTPGYVWVSAYINGKLYDKIDPTHRSLNKFNVQGNVKKYISSYGDYVNLKF